MALGAALLCPGAAFAATAPSPALVSVGVAIGAIALALAAALWALAEQRATKHLRRNLRQMAGRVRAAIGARDALLNAGRDALIVWGREGTEPFSYRGADALLDSCLAGQDATSLSQALDGLGDKGVPFTLHVHDRNGRALEARGRAVGGMAAVWLDPEDAVSMAPDFAAVLDALSIPVWLRDRALSLVWGNRAFLAATNALTLDVARANQVSLDKTERDLAAAARAEGRATEAKRFAVVGGQRRALEFTHVPLESGAIAGSALDVTQVANAEARLQQHVDAHADTLDKLATAVAVFGRDQKLTFYNRAFATLWGVPESWLDTHPGDAEVLDRLRELRKLPEQRDYQAWKRQRLSLYDDPSEYLPEELWHLPGGQTLRVVAQPHPFGGLSFLYEDVTEKLSLESSYNTLIKVQSATINTLKEGVAVFGPDGRMKLHNAAFERIWSLDEKNLTGEPHIRAIAAACAAKFGEDSVWEKLVGAITSGGERKRDWGEIERRDRSILSLALSPLPDGATLMTFADVTDRFRIESALRERNEALLAADHLKSEFIKHVSYELRTPLNPIKGYAELLASEVPGPLTPKQREFVNSIITSSQTLHGLINDILDLALVESGALRLELEQLDLYKVLSDIYTHAQQWAALSKHEVRLQCRPDVGAFVADRRRIQQVIVYLLSNALQFTPEGGIVTIGGDIQGEDVQLFVSDTGPGIAPDLTANVFDRFAARSQGGQRGGAGLGLTLVKSFIELHVGWVEIDSKQGRGTTVRCHLPRRLETGSASSVA
ncbi:MAG TPA: PAS-domain containing protein [Rhizomicrobium sp.]|nr:PAS-domain containing protein [Rhizomicrobium sp.]